MVVARYRGSERISNMTTFAEVHITATRAAKACMDTLVELGMAEELAKKTMLMVSNVGLSIAQLAIKYKHGEIRAIELSLELSVVLTSLVGAVYEIWMKEK